MFYRIICKKILSFDAMLMHCAAVSVDNEAYLFTAVSGTGKTTHINLWRKKFGDRFFVINGDKPIIRLIDGKFYVCPAFYQANSDTIISKSYNIGSLVEGLDIKNPQLYKLDHAPLCRKCDAYQCRRCIWLNRKTTLEVNTPSHEQCVVAHLERNASRDLLANIRKHGQFIPEREIKAIDYLDPFDMEDEY